MTKKNLKLFDLALNLNKLYVKTYACFFYFYQENIRKNILGNPDKNPSCESLSGVVDVEVHVDVISHRHVNQFLPTDVTKRLVPEHLLLVLLILLTTLKQVGVAREVLVGVDEEGDAPSDFPAPLRPYDAVRLES